MYFNTVLLATAAALFAGQALGAVAAAPINDGAEVAARQEMSIQIAPDPVGACNCPNNCRHKVGDSCAFYRNGNVLRGECGNNGANLICNA